ncbi:MAG: Elongation factor P--(R)-beta-lysine ligase [Pseudomonadota bacterium]
MHWQPSASLSALRARAAILQRIRAFFATRDVLEVEVPCLDLFPNTDPNMMTVEASCDGRPHFLQTSPEYAMKRLLARDGVSIYSLGKAFRDAEIGEQHNPEFTMLEWYRVGFDWRDLMQEVADLCSLCSDGWVVLAPPQFDSYAELFARFVSLDPHRAELSELQQACQQYTDLGGVELTRQECLDLLFSYAIEPHLSDTCLQFVYDYPACMAALARVETGEGGCAVTRRFELYYRGVELANGYQELTDAEEQAQRFAADEARRAAEGKAHYRGDPRLVAALAHGMPECAGVALGVDRLVMALLGEKALSAVQAFPLHRASQI